MSLNVRYIISYNKNKKRKEILKIARPLKNGIDYFPFDCYSDTSLQLIEAEFGLKGFAIITKILQKIYSEEGYFCLWSQEVALLFSKTTGEGRNVVSEIIASALKRGIFDKDLYDKFEILTSKKIQQQYFNIVKRRACISLVDKYLLLNPNREKISTENGVSVYQNLKSVNQNSQSKAKESKVNTTSLYKQKTPQNEASSFDIEEIKKKINNFD